MDTTTSAPPQQTERTGFRTGVALGVIVTCQLMVVLDNTVINIALAHIRSALRFSPSNLAWVVDAYTLPFGGLMLLGGRAGDVFGRRRMMIIGLVVFTAASLAGGFAQNPAMLIAARAVQGVGAATAAPNTLALIAATFTEGQARNKALAIFSGVSAAAGSLGLILGGVLTSGLSWRWVLFINVPIGIAVIVLAPLFVVEPPRRPARLDLPGAVLSTGALTLIIYGLIRIGDGNPATGLLAGLFSGGVVLFGLFGAAEARSASPLMPGEVILNTRRALLYATLFCLQAATYGMFFYVSQYAQNTLRYSALETGLAFLPLTVMIFILARLMPRVIARSGPFLPLLSGTVLVAASLVWLALCLSGTLTGGGYVGGIFGPLLVFGLGSGMCYVPLSATILTGVSRDHSGAASGIYQAMMQVGGSLGVAVLVTIASAHGRGYAIGAGAGFALLGFVLAVTVAALAVRRSSPSGS